jgi:outer membrane protein OmpA-like peptidoglycan-associated protein
MGTALLAVLWANFSLAAGINHFQPAAGPHNYVVTNHPAVLRHLTPSAWVLGSYARNPLVCRDAEGRSAYPIVEHQGNAELTAAVGLFDRFEVGASLPGVYVNGPAVPANPTALCGGFQPEGVNAFAVADPRAFAKVLLTPWNEGVVAAFRIATDVPLAQFSKQAGPFAGERRFPSLTPALTAGYSSEWFKVGVDLGMTFREPAPLGDIVIGQEVVYGAATEVTILPGTLFADLDLYGRAAPAFLLGSKNQFPLEAVVALKYFVGPVLLLAGAGTGLIADYGAPDMRVFAGVGFYPLPKKEPARQAPPSDRDGDGIPDEDDECPNEPEDFDGWQDADGCPDPDNDGDGILDADDECPNDPETFNGFEDEDGCPDALPGEDKVVVSVRRDQVAINDKVFFAFDSDRILPQSYGLLDEVARVIREHQEIANIRVEGHTDSDGGEDYNLQLSDRRAKSVRRYLIAAGVEAGRLEAEGYGKTRPIASNATEAGKAKNRRVEFRIVSSGEGQAKGDPRDKAAAPADIEPWEEEGWE